MLAASAVCFSSYCQAVMILDGHHGFFITGVNHNCMIRSELSDLLCVLCVRPSLDDYSISLNAEIAEADAGLAEKKLSEHF